MPFGDFSLKTYIYKHMCQLCDFLHEKGTKVVKNGNKKSHPKKIIGMETIPGKKTAHSPGRQTGR